MTFICSVPGHSDAGMQGEVVVATAGASAEPSHGDHERTAEEMRDVDAEVTGQFPAETEGRGNVILEPEVQADGTLQWELTASVIEWETEPGTVVEAYAYNGMVPGPQLRAEVGDRIRIILHNELPEPTTIHSHGLLVPPEMDGVPVISQPAVMPGETFTYEYTLRNAGSHMYHSHFMAETQVPMGLLGAFVVTDPNADEPDVDQDIAMILNDGPLGFTINGKGFPATEPIVAQQGDMIRIRYMNEGLQIHPMHLHGIPQMVIAKDGWTLPQPHFEDTVLVAPGERVDVLVDASEIGTWAFHCHVLTHAESPDGMFGMVTALIVRAVTMAVQPGMVRLAATLPAVVRSGRGRGDARPGAGRLAGAAGRGRVSTVRRRPPAADRRGGGGLHHLPQGGVRRRREPATGSRTDSCRRSAGAPPPRHRCSPSSPAISVSSRRRCRSAGSTPHREA